MGKERGVLSPSASTTVSSVQCLRCWPWGWMLTQWTRVEAQPPTSPLPPPQAAASPQPNVTSHMDSLSLFLRRGCRRWQQFYRFPEMSPLLKPPLFALRPPLCLSSWQSHNEAVSCFLMEHQLCLCSPRAQVSLLAPVATSIAKQKHQCPGAESRPTLGWASLCSQYQMGNGRSGAQAAPV